jgi:hypothetical protein
MAKAAPVRGVVRDEAGAVVPGARVWARSSHGSGHATAGADGRFEIDGLASGARVVAGAHAADGRRGTAAAEAGGEDATIVVRGTAGEEEWSASVVRILGPDGRPDPSGRATLLSDTFSFSERGAEAGELQVFLPRGGWLLARGDAGAVLHGPLRGGEARLDLRLEPAGAIAGSVRDEEGRPVPGVVAEARLADVPAGRSTAFTARTDERGSFAIERLPDAEYVLSFEGPPDRTSIPDRRARPGKPVEVVLPAGRVVTGEVVDDAGRPTPALVWAGADGDEAAWRALAVGDDGAFRIERAPAGAFPPRVGRPGWSREQPSVVRTRVEPGTAHVVVRAPASVTLVVRVEGLPRGLSSPGVVATEGGPPDAKTAQASGDGATFRFEGVALADHSFWVGPFPDGTYAQARGLRPGREHVVVARKGLPARGRVVGLPAGSHTAVRIWGPDVFCWTVADGDGRFAFSGLPPGAHAATATAADGDARFEGTGPVSSDAEAEIRVAPSHE